MSEARQQPGVTRDLSKCLSQMGVGSRQLGALAGGGESGSGVEPRGQCGPGDELEEGELTHPLQKLQSTEVTGGRGSAGRGAGARFWAPPPTSCSSPKAGL